MNLVIKGRVPSKKNSRRAIYVHGRTIMVPSKEYEVWHRDAEAQVKEQMIPVRVKERAAAFNGVKRILMIFYAPDKIRADLSNKAESVNDLLVDCNVIKDDNWWVVGELELRLGGLDRENPRVEIDILA